MKTIAAVRDGREDDGRMHSTSGRYVGLLYLAPALAFVVAFTALPVVQMLWMSLHNWSLIEPPKWVGFANYLRAYKDSQFWTSLRFTLTYTLYITPILMVGGFLIALLVAQNTNLRRFTRAVVFVPVVIGLGASSLLWYYLFSYDFGMVNRIALDLGIVRKPVVWFGENVDRSLWAVIASIVWKVIGFGMLLFVAAIQAIPGEIDEAAVVDGASYWQRVRRITLPLTATHHPPRDALQRHRIAARLRPVLSDDRGAAVQQDGDLGLLRLPEFLPLFEAGIRRGAFDHPGDHCSDLHGGAAHALAAEFWLMPQTRKLQ